MDYVEAKSLVRGLRDCSGLRRESGPREKKGKGESSPRVPTIRLVAESTAHRAHIWEVGKHTRKAEGPLHDPHSLGHWVE